jgi:hypothetical protein
MKVVLETERLLLRHFTEADWPMSLSKCSSLPPRCTSRGRADTHSSKGQGLGPHLGSVAPG